MTTTEWQSPFYEIIAYGRINYIFERPALAWDSDLTFNAYFI